VTWVRVDVIRVSVGKTCTKCLVLVYIFRYRCIGTATAATTTIHEFGLGKIAEINTLGMPQQWSVDLIARERSMTPLRAPLNDTLPLHPPLNNMYVIIHSLPTVIKSRWEILLTHPKVDKPVPLQVVTLYNNRCTF